MDVECKKCGGVDLDLHPTDSNKLQCQECGHSQKAPWAPRRNKLYGDD
jgi:primosomal protein N'